MRHWGQTESKQGVNCTLLFARCSAPCSLVSLPRRVWYLVFGLVSWSGVLFFLPFRRGLLSLINVWRKHRRNVCAPDMWWSCPSLSLCGCRSAPGRVGSSPLPEVMGDAASKIGAALIRQTLSRLCWGDNVTPSSPHPYLLGAEELGRGRVARRGDDQNACGVTGMMSGRAQKTSQSDGCTPYACLQPDCDCEKHPSLKHRENPQLYSIVVVWEPPPQFT